MEKRIFKYTLKTDILQNISMPKGSEILTIQTQFNEPHLWVLVDPSEKDKEKRFIEIFGTGHPIYDMDINRKYLGTYQLDDGNYIFHAFERLLD